MPYYTVECGKCGESREVFRPLAEFGKWPEHCGKQMRQIVQPPQIMADIVPFKSVVTDVDSGRNPVISSRGQLRDFERRNRCHRIGDDPPSKPKPFTPPPPVRQDLTKVVREVLSKKEPNRGR